MSDKLNRIKADWIKEIEQLDKDNNNIIFTAEGYCPTETEVDDLTGSGHYWTEWDELEAEELIDKIKDEDYIIEKWSFNILVAEKEEKEIINIDYENKSENQICLNCKEANSYEDLLCTNCYKENDKKYKNINLNEIEQER